MFPNKSKIFLCFLATAFCLFLIPVTAVADDLAYKNNSSLDETGAPDSELFDLIDYNIGIYNQNLDLAPGIVKKLICDEQILFVIATDSGGELYAWGTTENAEFIEFEKLEALPDQKPSLTVRTDESTVRSIIESSSPIQEYIEAVSSGKVTVEAAGLLQKLIFSDMNAGLADLLT